MSTRFDELTQAQWLDRLYFLRMQSGAPPITDKDDLTGMFERGLIPEQALLHITWPKPSRPTMRAVIVVAASAVW